MNVISSTSERTQSISINLTYIFWLISLLAYSSNNVIGSVALLASLPFVVFHLFKGTYNKMFFWILSALLVFSVVYGLISYYFTLLTPVSLIRQVYYPFALFMLGNLLVKNDINYKKTFGYLFAIIAGSALYGALSLYNATARLGIPIEHRTGVDIWNGANIAATGINSYISLGLCLLPIIFLSAKKENNLKWKIISIVAFSASAFAAIQLANRTGIIIVIASVLMVAILSKKTRSYMKNTLITIMVFGSGLLLYSIDAFGVRTWWENSLVYSRFIASNLAEDPRFDAWKLAFAGLYENPMGGRETEVGIYYAHNMWLDVGVDGGIISFALLVIFTLVALLVFFQFLKIKHPLTLKVLIVSIHAGFFVTFFFEPVLQGLMDYFTFYCFFVGVLLRINTDKMNRLTES